MVCILITDKYLESSDNMEFIKLREDRYLIKDSNGLIVSNEEKLKLERERLSFDKEKSKTDAELKRKQLNKNKVSK